MNNPQIIVKNAPFKHFCMSIGAIPTSYLDSLDYYETLLWLIKYLEEVIIPTVNNNGEAVSELQRLFIELKNFVDNYFDNLDVQEEINNKLDEMVEDGTLQTIIGDFLNANALWCFDTVEDMKSATNLINGSYAKTLGYYSTNDGGEGIYLITNSNDTEDNGSVINLTSGLQAHLITLNNEINVKQFGAKGNNIDNDTEKIQKSIDYAKNNNYSIFIPNGTYLISNIVINRTLKIRGEGANSVIKSINENESDSLIKFLNNGNFRSEISHLRINGNSSNNTNKIDGLMLTLDSLGTVGDMWTNIHDLTIQNCTGNGLSIVSEVSISAIREIRVDNINITSCGENGLFMNACADSYFSRISSHSNNKHGFVFDNGVHKCSDLKAFWNGKGDGVTIEDIDRLPVDAFEVSSDETPVSGRSYYYRTGTGINGDLYVYHLFTGESFEPDTVYYVMVKNYYKKYAGYLIKTRRSLFTNCEAQDNQGDGFYVTGSFNTIKFTSDNNGLLTDNENNPVSYASQNKTPLYYAIYNRSNRGCIYIGGVGNFRYANIGVCQKAPFFFRSASHISGTIQSENCLHDYIEYRSAGNNCTLECNCIPFIFAQDMTTFTFLNDYKNKTNDATSNDANYIYKINNIVYYRLVLRKTDTSLPVFPDNNEYGVLDLPTYLRPTKLLYRKGYTSGSGGYNLTGEVDYRISNSGRITAKSSNHTDNTMVLEGSYPLG